MINKFTCLSLFLVGLVSNSYAQFWDFTTPAKLNENINSAAEESMPVFSEDSLILYFVRTFDEENRGGEIDQDIWFSKKGSNGQYGKSERLTTLNNKLNNAVYGVNSKGDTIYLLNSYDGKKGKDRGIAIAQKKGGKWQQPNAFRIPTFQVQGDFVNYYVSNDERIILASYAGPDSKGEEDLFVLRKTAAQSWSSPINLGSVINSSGFEISPYMSKNLDTLYFSSNGHGGFGDADIFYSVRLDDSWTNWSKPINLGEKINSPKFDAYLIFADGQFYWSSNRSGEKSDLYYSRRLAPPPIQLTAKAIVVNDLVNGNSIDLTADGGGGNLHYAWSNGDTVQDPQKLAPGFYAVTVTDDFGQKATTEVEIKIPPAETFKSKSTDENPNLVSYENEREAELNKELNNNIIFFDDNSSYFNPENRVVLAKVIPILKSKPELKIFVQSYCDKNGTVQYNIWLSEKRMNRVIDYLVANGIERSRIAGNFKGEAEPLVNCKNCNERQLRLNRRTTIKFVVPK